MRWPYVPQSGTDGNGYGKVPTLYSFHFAIFIPAGASSHGRMAFFSHFMTEPAKASRWIDGPEVEDSEKKEELFRCPGQGGKGYHGFPSARKRQTERQTALTSPAGASKVPAGKANKEEVIRGISPGLNACAGPSKGSGFARPESRGGRHPFHTSHRRQAKGTDATGFFNSLSRPFPLRLSTVLPA